jgi:hypothetical protein
MRLINLGRDPHETDKPRWAEDVQGITHDDRNWYMSAQKGVWRIPVGQSLGEDSFADSTGIPPALSDDRYNHIGDIDWYQGHLYVPVERSGHPTIDGIFRFPMISVFTTPDLDLVGYAPFTHQRLQAGWCAIHPPTGELYSSAMNTCTVQVYKISVDPAVNSVTLDHLRSVDILTEDGSPLQLDMMQGGAFSSSGQYLFLSNHGGENRGIHVIDITTMRQVLSEVYDDPVFDDNFEVEGLTVWDETDPVAGTSTAELKLVFLNNDVFERDNLTIRNYRVVYDERPGEVVVDPQNTCGALMAEYERQKVIAESDADLVTRQLARGKVRALNERLHEMGCWPQ